MAKSDSTTPALDPVGPVDVPETKAPEVSVPETKAPEVEASETVKIELNPDYEADGDVYVGIADLPENLRVSKDDNRFKVGSATEVPVEVAEALAESAAVRVAE